MILEGEGFIEEKLCEKIFKIGPETFFQVNPMSANNIFEYVKTYISKNYENPLILDAYAGITTFGICLSDIAKKVVSVEEVIAPATWEAPETAAFIGESPSFLRR